MRLLPRSLESLSSLHLAAAADFTIAYILAPGDKFFASRFFVNTSLLINVASQAINARLRSALKIRAVFMWLDRGFARLHCQFTQEINVINSPLGISPFPLDNDTEAMVSTLFTSSQLRTVAKNTIGTPRNT